MGVVHVRDWSSQDRGDETRGARDGECLRGYCIVDENMLREGVEELAT